MVRTESALVQAIESVNQSNSRNTIDIRATGTMTLTAPLPPITGEVEISGPGRSRLTISGDGQYRVLFVDGGTVSIEDLTIADGFDRGGDGAVGKHGGAGGGAAGLGGGLFIDSGDVTINRVDFVHCSVIGGNGGDRSALGIPRPGNHGGGGGAGMAGDGLVDPHDEHLGGDGGPSGALGGLEGLGGARGQAGGDGDEGAGGGGGGEGRSFFISDSSLALHPDREDDDDLFGEPGGDGGHGGYGAGGGGGGEAGKGDGHPGAQGGDGGNGGFGGGAGTGGRGRSDGSDGQPGLAGVFGGSAGPNGEKAGAGGAAGLGGAIFIRNGSKVRLDTCSFSDNVACGGVGGFGRDGSDGEDGLGKAGAIFIDFNTDFRGRRMTFTDNFACNSLGISFDNDDMLDLRPAATASGGGGSGGGCFIASAAYGTPLIAEIDVLRDARDSYLLNHPFGAAFVDAYYRFSPPIADLVAQNPVFAAAVRTVLLPVIWLTGFLVAYPGVVLSFVLLTGFALTVRRVSRVTS